MADLGFPRGGLNSWREGEPISNFAKFSVKKHIFLKRLSMWGWGALSDPYLHIFWKFQWNRIVMHWYFTAIFSLSLPETMSQEISFWPTHEIFFFNKNCDFMTWIGCILQSSFCVITLHVENEGNEAIFTFFPFTIHSHTAKAKNVKEKCQNITEMFASGLFLRKSVVTEFVNLSRPWYTQHNYCCFTILLELTFTEQAVKLMFYCNILHGSEIDVPL